MIVEVAKIGRIKNQFLSQLNVTDLTKRRYRDALNSTFLMEIIREEYNKKSIFEIEDLELLWKLYSIVNLHPVNVRMHRYYSAPIMQYIRYLNGGKKYGRRIDYNRKRTKQLIQEK